MKTNAATMKEELKSLWKEYEEFLIEKGRIDEYWYESSVSGFWKWLITGEL